MTTGTVLVTGGAGYIGSHRSKLITEWMLEDVAASPAARGFRHVVLRYFNVAGASLNGVLGQATKAATHLIKVACEAAFGKR
jgi:UDP-glucose 4-epimerase